LSQFLGINPGGYISLGSTALDVHNTIKSELTTRGWRVVSEATGVNPTRLFVIPPATEEIGNAQCREVLYMEFGDNYINWRPVTEALLPYPQIVLLTPKTGGSSSNAITLDGVTVTQDPATLASGNTASQNLRFLYEALASSTDPKISDWDWVYSYPTPNPGTSDDTSPHVVGIRKTAVANVVITPNANVTVGVIGDYAAPGIQNQAVSNYCIPESLTTDLVNGCIYFMQISSRGIALAVRTNAAYTGPLHACWGNHNRAVSLVPESGKFSKFISPIELLVGADGNSSNLGSTARPAKTWGRHSYFKKTSAEMSSHPFTKTILAQNGFMDSCLTTGSNGDEVIPLLASSIWTTTDNVGDDFQVHRISMAGNYSRTVTSIFVSPIYVGRSSVVPAIELDDWYKFRGTATDENLQFVADTVSSGMLAQTIDGSSDYPSILLASTAGLAAAGCVVVENEAIEYTGISGNSIIGCSRGMYATPRVRHFQGAAVYQGLWFIKINGGALYAGTSRPV